MSSHKPFRTIIAELASLGDLDVRDKTFTGAQLSMLVAINPEIPVDEAARTPQLIYELARLCAAARADYEIAQAEFLRWREGTVFRLTTDQEFADEHGLLTTDSKKKPKLPAKTTANEYTRTLDEYIEGKTRLAKLEEVWASILGAYEAAKQRSKSILGSEQSGGTAPSRRSAYEDNGAGESYVMHAGQSDGPRETLAEAEAWAEQTERSPLPKPPEVTPGPPGTNNKTERKVPPPPPTRSA
jgi:hypothetical protein